MNRNIWDILSHEIVDKEGKYREGESLDLTEIIHFRRIMFASK